jgi:hypothetical protein
LDRLLGVNVLRAISEGSSSLASPVRSTIGGLSRARWGCCWGVYCGIDPNPLADDGLGSGLTCLAGGQLGSGLTDLPACWLGVTLSEGCPKVGGGLACCWLEGGGRYAGFGTAIGDGLEYEPLCPSVVCKPDLCDEKGPAKGLGSCVGAWLSLRASSASARCSSVLLLMAASCCSWRLRALSMLT